MSKHVIGKGEISGSKGNKIIPTFIYFIVFGSLVSYIVSNYYFLDVFKGNDYLFFIGALSLNSVFFIWRTSIKAFHYTRSFYYNRQFKKWRKKINYFFKFIELFFIVPFYKKPEITIINVVDNLLTDILDYGIDSKIFFSVTHGEEGENEKIIIKKRIEKFKRENIINFNLVIKIYKQQRKGKRHAMILALKTFFVNIHHPNKALIIMDGDTITVKGHLRRCLPFLLKKDIGGITCDINSYTNSDKVGFIQYMRMRLAKRRNLLCSVVTVMTGRWAVYKGTVINENFYNFLGNHCINHPRLGKYFALSGDDKSTYLALLMSGFKVLFIPDQAILTMEEVPVPVTKLQKTFWFINVQQNFSRYANNMFNFAGELMRRLNPEKIGYPLYFTVIDQRYFYWTPLVSRLSIIILTIRIYCTYSIDYAFKFFLMCHLSISFMSFLETLVIYIWTKQWSPHWIYLLPMERTTLAILKVRRKFFVNMQSWREGIKTGKTKFSSYVYLSMLVIFLIMFACLMTGTIQFKYIQGL